MKQAPHKIYSFRLKEMYPSLDATSTQMQFKTKLPPSEAMSLATVDLQQKGFAITSFKPHLNYYECFFSMIVQNKMNLPIRVVFLRNYPKEKPILYVTKWIQQSIVKPNTCQIQYEAIFNWNQHSKLSDLIKQVQTQFNSNPPSDKTDFDKAYAQLDDYQKQVQSLKNKPLGTQPPPPPQVNLENILKTFEFQQNLASQCSQKNSVYLMAAQQYSENVSRVRCISERFGKGKILRELEKELEAQMMEVENAKIDDLLKKYYESRKKYHRIKILKELYLEQ